MHASLVKKTLLLLVSGLFVHLLSPVKIYAADWQHIQSGSNQLEAPNSGNQQTASLILDIDKDGILDFVITERTATPSVVWYKKNGNRWERRVIENSKLRIEAGGAYSDIDKDGDLDIVFAGDNRSNEIWWWENPFPNYGSAWNRHLIKQSGGNKHHDQLFTDVDGDGAEEFVTWNQGDKRLYFAEIPSNPKNLGNWNLQKKFEYSGTTEFEGLTAYNMDGSGGNEIIGGGRIFTYNGGGDFSVEVVAESRKFTRAAVGQIIPGGKPEIIFGPGDENGPLTLYYYESNTWKERVLISNHRHGHSLQIIDIDKDGDLDVFTAEMGINGITDPKTYLFINDGSGNLQQTQPFSNQAHHESRVADLDGDGDFDILAKPYNWNAPRIDIYLQQADSGGSNDNPLLKKWSKHLVTANMGRSAYAVWGDFDRDGKLDLAAGSKWYRNPGTLGGSWTAKNIGSPLTDVALAFDIDNDGDTDLFGTQTAPRTNIVNSFAWAENDGSGSFTIRTNIPNAGAGDFLQGVAVGDFGTGKQILLSWHAKGAGVQALSIPSDPKNTGWRIVSITNTQNMQEEDLSIGNIDRAGGADVLLGTKWLKNLDGTNWQPYSIGEVETGTPDRNDLADINGDGRLDAVVSLENGKQIYWFEAPADPTQTWTRHLIRNIAGEGFSMDVADFDKDGDMDVVVGEHKNSPNNRVIILENQDKGNKWGEYVIDTAPSSEIDHHDGTQVVDLDGDGDLDIVSLGWSNTKLWVYENTTQSGGTCPNNPDITRDGKVNIFDYNKLIENYNPDKRVTNNNADINCDGFVNIFDYNKVITNYQG